MIFIHCPARFEIIIAVGFPRYSSVAPQVSITNFYCFISDIVYIAPARFQIFIRNAIRAYVCEFDSVCRLKAL